MTYTEEREYTGKGQILRWLIGAAFLIAPFIAVTVSIYFEDPMSPNSVDYVFPWYVYLAVFVVLGVIGIHVLPIARWLKGILTAISVVVLPFGIMLYSVSLACSLGFGCL
ncbi:MAG: hypothetical protein ABJ242_02020 [Marinomonas sp.]